MREFEEDEIVASKKPNAVGVYDVFVTFMEEGKVTLAAPSEEAAIALVKEQYADRLSGLIIQGAKFLEEVNSSENRLIH